MKYKLVALDLDGTTVKFGNKIPRANKKEIIKLLSNDIKVIIATGRSVSAIRKVATELKIIEYKMPVIAFNGGVIYDFANNQKIYESSFRAPVVSEIFKLCRKYNLIAWAYAADNDSLAYVNNITAPIIKWMSFYTRRKTILVSDKYLGNNVYKFVISGELNNVSEFKKEIAKHQFSVFDWSYRKNSRRNIEISPYNVDKQQALSYLANYYAIKEKEIIAIGDGNNDIGMIKWAGLGIAMSNAKDDIKAIADEVTLHHRKAGVAAALKKHINISEK